jgi:hypothetical protein
MHAAEPSIKINISDNSLISQTKELFSHTIISYRRKIISARQRKFIAGCQKKIKAIRGNNELYIDKVCPCA